MTTYASIKRESNERLTAICQICQFSTINSKSLLLTFIPFSQLIKLLNPMHQKISISAYFLLFHHPASSLMKVIDDNELDNDIMSFNFIGVSEDIILILVWPSSSCSSSLSYVNCGKIRYKRKIISLLNYGVQTKCKQS